MIHPIIKTDNYILITSDEEIKEGDYWHYLGEKDNPVKNVLGKSWFEKLHDVKMYKKVIAHLPLNNLSILEGVPLLPPLPNEEDFDKKLLTEEYEQAKQMEKEQIKMHNKYYPNSDEEWKQDKEQEDWYWEQLDNDFNEISDEEIEKAAKECVYEDLDISVGSFELGARWYREQLKKKL